MKDANHRADGHNPLAETSRLYLKLEGELVADASFEGSGCAISTAAASLMTKSLRGKRANRRWRSLIPFMSF